MRDHPLWSFVAQTELVADLGDVIPVKNLDSGETELVQCGGAIAEGVIPVKNLDSGETELVQCGAASSASAEDAAQRVIPVKNLDSGETIHLALGRSTSAQDPPIVDQGEPTAAQDQSTATQEGCNSSSSRSDSPTVPCTCMRSMIHDIGECVCTCRRHRGTQQRQPRTRMCVRA